MNPLSSLRHCVFCGQPPIDKNNEHVLSEWVVNLTGDPNRILNISLNWQTGKVATFAADKMVAPSCERCNTIYSVLEKEAKLVFSKIDAREAILTEEANTILNWIDKVRVGVWLFKTMLNKNPFSVNPNFRIDQRIGAKDRILLIYPYSQSHKGFNLVGTDSPLFYLMPSCFGLRINGTLFISCSHEFLISNKMGFPFPQGVEFKGNGSYALSDFRVNETVKQCYLPIPMHKFSMGFGQVCHSKEIYYPNQELYRGSSLIDNVVSGKLTSKIILFDQFGQDSIGLETNSLIPYGFIMKKDAVPFWKLLKLVFDMQEHLYRYSKFSGVKKNANLLLMHKKFRKMIIDPYRLGKAPRISDSV